MYKKLEKSEVHSCDIYQSLSVLVVQSDPVRMTPLPGSPPTKAHVKEKQFAREGRPHLSRSPTIPSPPPLGVQGYGCERRL